MTTAEGQPRLRIRLFPDYAGTVLWLDEPVSFEVSGLSPELVHSLQAWEESYYRSLTPDFEWVSDGAARLFTAEGNRLAQRLADELGDGYEVSFKSYEDGVPRRIFRSSGAAPNAAAVAAFNKLNGARPAEAGRPGSGPRPTGNDAGWYAWAPLSDTAFKPPPVDGE
ncbi:hypothetical protein ACWGQ2_09370 [Arthrobacter sp. NPDC055585]